MKGLYRIQFIAKKVGLNVVMPEPGRRGTLWVEDLAQDLSIATLQVSRRGAVTSGHGWTPDRQLVHFRGRHKVDQVTELLQRYDPTLKQTI